MRAPITRAVRATRTLWIVGSLGVGACRPTPSEPPSTPPEASPRADASPRSEVEGTTGTPHVQMTRGPTLGGTPKPRVRPDPIAVTDRDAAIEAIRRGNLEGGRDFLVAHLAEHPGDDDARWMLVRAHRALGNRDAALQVLDGSPAGVDAPPAVQLRALVWTDRGDGSEARRVLEAGLRRYPDALALKGDLVNVLVGQGQAHEPAVRALLDELYDAYEGGRARSAGDLLAVAFAALARGSRGAFKDANMVLDEAEAASAVEDATLAGDRVRLVRAAMFAEKYAVDEAITTFHLLLARDAWHPEALAGLARVHADNLQFSMATRVAREALQVDPGQPDAHAVLAKVALVEGRREEARSRLREHTFVVNPGHTSGLAAAASLALVEAEPDAYDTWRDRALQSNPHNGPFYRELADILTSLHLYPEVDEVLSDGIQRAPDDPYVRAARGLNLLRLGDEATARRDLAQAWKADPFNERTRNILDLYERSIDAAYSDHRAGDLTLRLPDEDGEFVRDVLVESTRWSRAALDAAYDTQAGKLRLEFFRAPEEFSIRTVGVPHLGAVAVCFGPVITFMGPFHGTHNIENVIRHELAHVYAIRRSRGRVPRWFTEGLSEWESELADPAWARESAELLQRARKAGKLRRLSELELAFVRAESPIMMEVAYATAAYAIRFLGREYGRDELVAILDGYGRGATTETLFPEHLGATMAELEQSFERWLHAELDAKVTGWHPADPGDTRDERDGLFRRARKQLEAGEYEAAELALKRLIELSGDGYAPRMMFADALMKDHPDQAEAHLRAARGFHVEALTPVVRLAELARRQDRPAVEMKWLSEALDIDGESFEPAARLLLLAEVTDDAGPRDRALRRVRAIAPLHPLALSGWALAQVRRGDRDGARRSVDRVAEALDPDEPGPADTLAMVAFAAAATEQPDVAAKVAEAALGRGGLPTVVQQRLVPLLGGR